MRLLFHITGFTFFPFLLLRGPAHLSRRVLQWLQNTFDCHISLLQLSQDDLAMLVGQYATSEKGSSVAQPMSSLEGFYDECDVLSPTLQWVVGWEVWNWCIGALLL